MSKSTVDSAWLQQQMHLAELGNRVVKLVDEWERLSPSPKQADLGKRLVLLVNRWENSLLNPNPGPATKPAQTTKARKQTPRVRITVEEGVGKVRDLKVALRNGELTPREWAGQLAAITKQIAMDERPRYRYLIGQL